MKELQLILTSSVLILLFVLNINAQDEQKHVYQTFKSVQIVNMQSTETLKKRNLDVRIGHKFGDLAGSAGGYQSFFGLENAADIMIGVSYGITDDIQVGVARIKGSQGLIQNTVGSFKYKILKQTTEKGMPFTMTFAGISTMSTQKKIEGANTIQAFEKFSHRFAYAGQLILARKFGERFSLQVSPGYIHRNIVPFGDKNGLFYLGLGTRVQISKVFGIIADATYPFSSIRTRDNNYYPSVGVGLEIETGGHVFQINFTNSTGISETDYVPYTRTSWLDGQFRLAFTISRLFNL